jgi:hypothetical protein
MDECAGARDPNIATAVLAVGCLDAHGSGADAYELARLVPDKGDREHVLAVAAQLKEHSEFRHVRDALRARLMFKDRLSKAEIERIARSATFLT